MRCSELVQPLSRAFRTDPKIMEGLIQEVEDLALFQYQYVRYSKLPDFLNKEPYRSFVDGHQGILLCVCTLGELIDRRIAQLERLDLARAYLFDRVAGRVLEYMADEYEKSLPWPLSPRFCPGYSGSSLSDNREIIERVRPAFTVLNDSCIMSPAKSMAGLCAIGVSRPLSACQNCPKEEETSCQEKICP